MPLSPLPAGVFKALNLYLRYNKCNFRPVKVKQFNFSKISPVAAVHIQ
jgi:hypothetical protein